MVPDLYSPFQTFLSRSRSVGGDSDISLDALEPTFPAAVNKRVHFAEETGNNSTLVWPVLFIYPEFGETDFIEQFQEDQVFSDHVLAMFGPDVGAAPWDTEAKYVHDRIKIYFEDTERDVLVQVDTGKSLRSLVGDARYSVIGGTPSFIVLSDGSKFQKEFLGRYKKME